MNPGGNPHNYLPRSTPFQGRALGGPDADYGLFIGGTSGLDAGPSSTNAWARNSSQSIDLETNGVIYHDMNAESIFARAPAYRTQAIDQTDYGTTQYDLLGSSFPSLRSTSSVETINPNPPQLSLGIGDVVMPTSSTVQTQNPDGLRRSSDFYSDNMNVGSSSSQNPGDFERFLADLIVPPQNQLLPYGLDCLFRADDQLSGTYNAQCPNQPLQVNQLSLGRGDVMMPTSSTVQTRNPDGLRRSSDFYLDNMNVGSSSSQNPGDFERFLANLIVSPQNQLLPYGLDCLFPVDVQLSGTYNAQCPNQPLQYEIYLPSVPSPPITSSCDLTTLALARLRGTHDAVVVFTSAQDQNRNDVCGSSNSYSDNINLLSENLGDLEKLLDELIIPPERHLQPSDLDSLFSEDDQFWN